MAAVDAPGPGRDDHVGPWTRGVLGAIFCLGIAGLGAPLDQRADPAPGRRADARADRAGRVRAAGDLDPSNAMTWLIAAGFAAASQ